MKYLKSILILFLFSLIAFFVSCQDEPNVIEPQANVVTPAVNLGKITIKKQLVVTDSLMAIQIMDDAWDYFIVHQTYIDYVINPEYIVEDTLGNDQFWFDFYWYVDAFGGDYHIINLQPYPMEYNQFFYVNNLNERKWGNENNYIPLLDVDGDKYTINDCNDNDPLINPNAIEIKNNGIDENCNGTEDDWEGIDGDEDGWYINAQIQSDVDFNDASEFCYPGAVEACGDGLDNNGDGNIDEGCWTAIDVDNDGWLDNINPNDPTRQLDCDDNEPNINPGANEIYYNGLDENCNGMEDDFLPFEADINLEDLYDGNVSLYHPFDLITLTFPDFILTSGKNFKFEVSGYAEALTGAWLFSESPAFFTPNVFTHTNPEWLYEMGQNTFLDRIIRFDGEWPESIWPPNFNQEGIYYRMISGNGQQISVNLWSAIGNGSVGHPVGTFHIKLIEVTD